MTTINIKLKDGTTKAIPFEESISKKEMANWINNYATDFNVTQKDGQIKNIPAKEFIPETVDWINLYAVSDKPIRTSMLSTKTLDFLKENHAQSGFLSTIGETLSSAGRAIKNPVTEFVNIATGISQESRDIIAKNVTELAAPITKSHGFPQGAHNIWSAGVRTYEGMIQGGAETITGAAKIFGISTPVLDNLLKQKEDVINKYGGPDIYSKIGKFIPDLYMMIRGGTITETGVKWTAEQLVKQSPKLAAITSSKFFPTLVREMMSLFTAGTIYEAVKSGSLKKGAQGGALWMLFAPFAKTPEGRNIAKQGVSEFEQLARRNPAIASLLDDVLAKRNEWVEALDVKKVVSPSTVSPIAEETGHKLRTLINQRARSVAQNRAEIYADPLNPSNMFFKKARKAVTSAKEKLTGVKPLITPKITTKVPYVVQEMLPDYEASYMGFMNQAISDKDAKSAVEKIMQLDKFAMKHNYQSIGEAVQKGNENDLASIWKDANIKPVTKTISTDYAQTVRSKTDRMVMSLYKLFQQLPRDVRWRIISEYERNGSVADPALNKALQTMDDLFARSRAGVESVNPEAAKAWNIEYYFPHMIRQVKNASGKLLTKEQTAEKLWVDLEKSYNNDVYWKSRGGFDGFLKERKMRIDISRVMELGYRPVSENPMDLVAMRIEGMQNYIFKQEAFQWAINDSGYTWVRKKVGEKPPADFVRVRGSVPGIGLDNVYMLPDVARIFNNMYSERMLMHPALNLYHRITGSMISAKVALSTFHLMFTNTSTMADTLALGYRKLGAGDIKGAAKAFGATPFMGVYNAAVKGPKLIEEYLNQGFNPDLKELVDWMVKGGYNPIRDRREFGAVADMYKAWALKEAGKPIQGVAGAIVKAPFAGIEYLSNPVAMAVRNAKIGAYANDVQNILKRMQGQDESAIIAELQKAERHVSQVFGQENYPNFFWNKLFSDAMHSVIAYPGWNIGNLGLMYREIHGDARAKGFIPALFFVNAVSAGIFQYSKTKTFPTGVEWVTPWNGEYKPDGTKQLVNLPAYTRDFISYATRPLVTFEHKTSPGISLPLSLLYNEDYLGKPTRDTWKQVLQTLGSTYEPIPVSNYMRHIEAGKTPYQAFLEAESGASNVPAEIMRTKAEQMVLDVYKKSGFESTPESQARRKLKFLIVNKKATNKDVLNGIRNGSITSQEYIDIKHGGAWYVKMQKFPLDIIFNITDNMDSNELIAAKNAVDMKFLRELKSLPTDLRKKNKNITNEEVLRAFLDLRHRKAKFDQDVMRAKSQVKTK